MHDGRGPVTNRSAHSPFAAAKGHVGKVELDGAVRATPLYVQQHPRSAAELAQPGVARKYQDVVGAVAVDGSRGPRREARIQLVTAVLAAGASIVRRQRLNQGGSLELAPLRGSNPNRRE